jgi:hypothetical protein
MVESSTQQCNRHLERWSIREFRNAVGKALEMACHSFKALRILPMTRHQRPCFTRHFSDLSGYLVDHTRRPPTPKFCGDSGEEAIAGNQEIQANPHQS